MIIFPPDPLLLTTRMMQPPLSQSSSLSPHPPLSPTLSPTGSTITTTNDISHPSSSPFRDKDDTTTPPAIVNVSLPYPPLFPTSSPTRHDDRGDDNASHLPPTPLVQARWSMTTTTTTTITPPAPRGEDGQRDRNGATARRASTPDDRWRRGRAAS